MMLFLSLLTGKWCYLIYFIDVPLDAPEKRSRTNVVPLTNLDSYARFEGKSHFGINHRNIFFGTNLEIDYFPRALRDQTDLEKPKKKTVSRRSLFLISPIYAKA